MPDIVIPVPEDPSPPVVPEFDPPPVIPGESSSGTTGNHNRPDESDNTPENQRKVFEEVLKYEPLGWASLIIALFFFIFFISAVSAVRRPKNKESRRICFLLACACASFVAYFVTGGVTHLGSAAGNVTGIVEIVFLSLGNSIMFSTLFAAIRVRLRRFLIAVILVLLSSAGFIAAGVVANPNGIIFDATMIAYNSFLLITALTFWLAAQQANKQDGTKFTHWSSKFLGLWLASASIVLLTLSILGRINNPDLEAVAITGDIFDSDDISNLSLPLEVLNFLLGKVITWGVAMLTATSLVLAYYSPRETERRGQKA